MTAGAEERLLFPPRHVSPGCFQASPLYSPCPVLCLCACSVVVTSLAVSHLQVVFWGHPSHKAGARGAVLVLIHSRFEGQPARQVCFLCHRLTPGLHSDTSGVPWGTRISQFPQQALPGRRTESLLFLYPYLCPYAWPAQPSPAQGLSSGRDCQGTSIPATAARTGWVLFPALALPAALGTRRAQHMALPLWQQGCEDEGSAAAGQSPSLEGSAEGWEEESLRGSHSWRQKSFVFLTKQLLLGWPCPTSSGLALVGGSSS